MLHLFFNHNTGVWLSAFILLSISATHFSTKADDNLVKNIQKIKTFKAPGEMVRTLTNWESPMNTCFWNEYFFHEKTSLWREQGYLVVRYSIPSDTLDRFRFDFNIQKKWQERPLLSKLSMNSGRRSLHQMMIVSPNEQYILFRYSPTVSELYELKTGQRLLNGNEEELIIGFDQFSNIYCSRPCLESMFLLRDLKTMEILETYNTELLVDDPSTRMNYAYLAPLFTTNGRYTLFFLIASESQGQGIVLICDNEKRCIIGKEFLDLKSRLALKPVVRHDNRFVAIPNGSRAVLLYDVENQSFHNFSITSTVPPSAQNFTQVRGFGFTPDDKVVMWIEYPRGSAVGPSTESLRPYQLDLITHEQTLFEDFLTPGRYTSFFCFNVPHGITITHEIISPATIYTGKYVFWDFQTKEKIFETEAKYYPNIIVSPDGKHIYLTSTEQFFENYHNEEARFLSSVDVFELQ